MRNPVVVVVRRVVPSPVTAVWTRQVGAADWTTWHPDVSWVTPGTTLSDQVAFEWVWRGTRARSRVTTCRPDSALAWTSETVSGTSALRWSFVPHGDTTLVRAAGLIDGAHVLSRRPAAARQGLQRALTRWLDALEVSPRDAVPA
jgi:hypothetical protein